MPQLGKNEHYLGTRNNGVFKKTFMSKFEQLTEHVHSISYCYPTLATGVTLTAGTPAWTLGSATLIVPANTIEGDYFDIHYINIEDMAGGTTHDYELHLFNDLACTILVGKKRFTKDSALTSVTSLPFMTEILLKTNPIYGKLASSTAGTTSRISIQYHSYS